MIPKGLFTQIGMIAIGIGILVTYVQPSFSGIAETQDKIATYQTEREKVAVVNSKLDSLVAQLESVSRDDNQRLNRYLPNEVDGIAVTRDLALISFAAGVAYENSAYSGPIKRDSKKEGADVMPDAHGFNYSVQGTYSQIKNLFRLLEQNDYPLEVHELNIKQNDGGFLTVNMRLITYSYQPFETKEIVF